MRTKKGFISTSIIYSFFLVFILLMIAFLMSFVNKRHLNEKTKENLEVPPDVLACTKESTLSECLFKSEYIEYVNTDDQNFLNKNSKLASASFTEQSIKSQIIQKGTPNFNNVATTEEGMFAAKDDYGTSYYYRGAEDDNYVVFADQVWQIIRINGDGSIRMILKETSTKNCSNKTTDHIVLRVYLDGTNRSCYESFHYAASEFSKMKIDSASSLIEVYEPYVFGICTGDNDTCGKIHRKITSDYFSNAKNIILQITDKEIDGAYERDKIGYMSNHGLEFRDDLKYANEDNSILKELNDTWYENYLSSYSEYLSNSTIFCGDKEEVDYELDAVYMYAGNKRILDRAPILKCVDTGSRTSLDYNKVFNLSRYNVDDKVGSDCELNNEVCGTLVYAEKKGLPLNEGYALSKSTRSTDKKNQKLYSSLGMSQEELKRKYLGNGNLIYPIGLISADEINMAGGRYGYANTKYYLYSTNAYWTMTLSNTSVHNGAKYFGVNSNGTLTEMSDQNSVATIRPVINLKSDILYCSGDGTASNPYIIGNGSC